MPEGFTTPPTAPKIAPIVPLDKADQERQKQYGALAQAETELARLPCVRAVKARIRVEETR